MTSSNKYESVPYSVVSSLLNNLNYLISSSDFGKTYGVADQLQNIQSNIQDMNSKLPEVERKKTTDILQWLRRSKPLLLAADDLFDDIATDNMLLLPDGPLNCMRKVRRFFSSSNLFVYRSRIARELIETEKNVNDIVEGMRQLKLSQGHESSLRVRTTTSNIFDVGMIGRDEDKRVIIEQLMQHGGEEENLALIAIVGFAGIGKTTLARMVYDDDKVKGFFQKQMWVHVSKDFEVETIVRSILQELIPTIYKRESLDQNVGLLRQILNSTRYLLVLDDVWNTSHAKWAHLASYLMCGAEGKGWEIEKNELIQSWMAQGYLQCVNDDQQQMEDLGNEFVNTLLMMSFFVSEKQDKYCNLVSFKMSQLIHHIVVDIDIYFDQPTRDINDVHMSLPMKSYNNIGLSNSIDLKVITRLTNLRHLEIHRCKAFEDMMPAGLGKLSSLQSSLKFHVVDDKKKKAAKLNELQNLNNLRGNLEINVLYQVKDAMMESQLVNMKEKNLLESLDLNWEKQDNIEADNFKLLQNLCPHQNLKGLHVRWYPGNEFADWLSSTNHLSHISLFGFNNCKSLPPIENLPNLKSLEIGSMKVLECIYFKVESSTAPAFFESLERLKLSGCKNFKGWKMMGGEVNQDHPSLRQFRRLSQLIINKCPKLIDLPTFPKVVELQLYQSMVKPLKNTLDIASSSSSATPLSMIKSLKIEGKLPDISILPSRWKQNLTSLNHLEIGNVDDLGIWFEDNFTALQKVVIYGCDLKALPIEMCYLPSLEHIKIMGCHNLESLPKEMDNLTKLVTLEISNCPLLVERCQKITGEDWPKIQNIQNIIVRQNLR
ncbi:hypothetical protein TSUD_277260 [Trifolium subterraneum]|uniref:Uncharacterized protein n=1 Tax=Trifolium subterraneum TaxID=3900 RepID=A0A2Z6MTZ6_TRISU|nr:hypothetical protein TSUD_277260 [Trifolium subterraneum]